MPTIRLNGCKYFYQDVGQGPETIVFGHGFLMTHELFAHQVSALQNRYRCIALDWRGQGRSQVTADGYEVPQLCDDVVTLIELLELGPVHYVGLSMGGFVGYHLALRRPDLLRTLTLMDTTADAEQDAARRRYAAMLWTLRLLGYGPLRRRVLPLFFGPHFRHDPYRRGIRERWERILVSHDRRGAFRAGMAIFSRSSVADRLAEITTPTLVLVGAQDETTPLDAARRTAEAVPDAQLAVIPEAGHSAPVENPDAVTAALEAFLDGPAP